jgi:hypothetical protein
MSSEKKRAGQITSLGGVFDIECAKCTFSQVFTAPNSKEGISLVVYSLGWRRVGGAGSIVCPECAGVDVSRRAGSLKFPGNETQTL